MLILNTPDGDFAIAKGNIHTIQEDYDVGYYYVTKDIASYPFRSINGIKVKDIDHAYELVDKYADENGEQPMEMVDRERSYLGKGLKIECFRNVRIDVLKNAMHPCFIRSSAGTMHCHDV